MSDEITNVIRPFETDETAVEKFAGEMLGKLRRNSRKKPWPTVSYEYLFERLLKEVEELREAMTETDGNIVSECADVANFAMMIADNLSREGATRPFKKRESITGVTRPSDRELLRRAVEGARTETGSISSARWSCVGQALSVGSTTATRLCVEFGLDPDDQLEGRYCEGCPWVEEGGAE